MSNPSLHKKTKDHWLFWPLVSLLLLIAVFIFFFSDSGYFAYLNKVQEKNTLVNDIKALEKQNKSLLNTLGNIDDDNNMVNLFIKKLKLYDDTISVLQFESNIKLSENTDGIIEKYNLKKLQRMFVIIANIIIIAITFVSWRFLSNEEREL